MRLILSYCLHPYRPRLRLDRQKLRELWGFGIWVSLTGITVFLGDYTAEAVIGKIIGATALGLYHLAYWISRSSIENISVAIAGVTFPTLSKLQDHQDRFRNAFLKLTAVSCAFSVFMAFGIIIFGEDFTILFLGEKWSGMIPSLRILAVAGFLTALAVMGRPAFLGGGKPRFLFQMQAARAVCLLLIVFPLCRLWGIEGAAVAMLVSSVAMLTVSFIQARSQFQLTSHDIWEIIVPPLTSAAATGGIVFMTSAFIDADPGLSFLAKTGLFIARVCIATVVYMGLLAWIRSLFLGTESLRSVITSVMRERRQADGDTIE
jgi:O-antigen/teichoic acid export membrane protein